MAKQTLGYGEGIRKLQLLLSVAWSAALTQLLTDKHIYQKVTVDMATLVAQAKNEVLSADEASYSALAPRITPLPLALGKQALRAVSRNREEDFIQCPDLILANIKLACPTCGQREAFIPVWFNDVTNAMSEPSIMGGTSAKAPPIDGQLFLLTYHCQACTNETITFLVRRKDASLLLEGRSPFEELELPAFLPKSEKKFFRDALIAYHGGKTLAALFYLRTFLEQFARRVTGISGRETGESIMESYAATIPLNLRSTMPSLGEWYGKLSEALHLAQEDANIFEEAMEQIIHHFDLRRVHRLSESPQPIA